DAGRDDGERERQLHRSRLAPRERRERAREVRACAGFVRLPHSLRAVDPLAPEELLEDLAPLAPKDDLRHPVVFGTHVALVLVEALRLRAEDREVHVDEHARVRTCGRRLMPRRHDQRCDSLPHRRVEPGAVSNRARPLRTAPLVVMPPRVVHRIVKPQRELDLRGPLRLTANRVEHLEALLEMPLRVVAPMLLGVPPDDIVKEVLRGRGADCPPRRAPPFIQRHNAAEGTTVGGLARAGWTLRASAGALRARDGAQGAYRDVLAASPAEALNGRPARTRARRYNRSRL